MIAATHREESLNRLDQATSPYLLQHKDNPVHWTTWGPDAFAEAKRRGVPVLLSVGYAACHWCHVMAHESFEDPATAAVMNELFVNIKVDREERPDVDTIYQSALALLGESGGWPLTMFLTPDGEPFWGGTYFPPSARYGRPGFIDVLKSVHGTFLRQPDTVAKNVGALKDALGKLSASRAGGMPSLEDLDKVARSLARNVDPFFGGFGGAPKFPNVPGFLTLWRAWIRTGLQPFLEAVTVTLNRMCQGGIYDHLGGGFARYSVDEEWLVPHFEKMLYDNAELIDLLTLAWQDMKTPLYQHRVEETIAWLFNEMIVGNGGFASSLDADSEGEEGRFYVWTEKEIDQVLGEASPSFKRAYDVTALGNWEHSTILNRSRSPDLLSPDEEGLLGRARAKLLEVRAGRVRPGFDDKTLADWNGQMIAALANAALAFQRPDWLEKARAAFAYVERVHGRGDRLLHSARDGKAQHAGLLDDYAQMTRAALTLYEASGEGAYLAKARAWSKVLDAHFWDAQNAGYFFTPDDGEALIVRTRNAHDNATPSGNGTQAANLARLWYLTGEASYRDRAEAVIGAFSGDVSRSAMAFSTLLNAAELLLAGQQIVIVGDRAGSDTKALLDAVAALSLPNRVLQVIAPGDALPAAHPAHGKGQVDGKATIYVCEGTTCSLPVTEAAQVPPLLLPR
ncbi:MAG: thioredoxin domain-containing protein [Rhodospirillaceae bacterium]|nr:thioredoxin domain-containing protein [Rhodospirillaceae bacterium]